MIYNNCEYISWFLSWKLDLPLASTWEAMDTCTLLWESVNALDNTADDSPHVPERRVFLGHWHRILPLGPGMGIRASGGVGGVELEAEKGGENGLSTGAWEAEEYEGVLLPGTAARWTADDFCSSKYSAGWGGKRKNRRWRCRGVKTEGKREGAGGERRRAQVKVLVIHVFIVWSVTCSSKLFVCPNMSCQEKEWLSSTYLLHPAFFKQWSFMQLRATNIFML